MQSPYTPFRQRSRLTQHRGEPIRLYRCDGFRPGARHYRPLMEDKPFAAAEHAIDEVLDLGTGEITFH